MLEILRLTMLVGLVFGVLFSLVAYLVDYSAVADYLLIIPFFSALLSGLGGIIASLTDKFLASKGFSQEKVRQMISFASAALVNTLIVLLIVTFSKQVFFQGEVLLVMLLGLVFGLAYQIYSYRVGRLKERMEFLEQLAEKNCQIQEASRRLAITEERNRLGRELHDSVSQGLHGLIFSIHSLRNDLKSPPPRITAILDHMSATANSTLDELRTMIEELKPSLLVEQGLSEALKVTTNLFSQRQEVPVELQINIPNGLSPELEMAIYRICQESLANIEKHASAEHVTINISFDENYLLLVIKDDGNGFDPKVQFTGNGLKNMCQRVEELGGTIDVISKTGLGTSLKLTFPLKGGTS